MGTRTGKPPPPTSRRTTGVSSTYTRRLPDRRVPTKGVALLATLFILLSGAKPLGAAPGRRTAIAELLNARAAAVRAGDEQAFAETIAGAPAAFRRRQLRWFRGIVQLPPAAYSLEADWSAYGDLARPSDVASYPGADDVAIPLTSESYRIAEIDRKPVPEDQYLTFVQRDGEWHVEGDDDLEDVGLYTQRNVWDFGGVERRRGPHFLALASDCGTCGAELDAILAAAEPALAQVDSLWGTGWHRKVPLLVPPSAAALGAILQATYPVENYLAFAFWTGPPGPAAGARVIVNPDRVAPGDPGVRAVLAHELTHVAMLGPSGPFVPVFVHEGFAQYVQYGGAREVIEAAGAGVSDEEVHLPDDHEFFVADRAQVLGAYREALSAVGFMIDRWGLARFHRFYEVLGDAAAPGTQAFHLDRALRRTLGVSKHRFERLWRSSIGSHDGHS